MAERGGRAEASAAGRDLAGMPQLSALMRERQIDLVHSHMYRSNVPATVAARMDRPGANPHQPDTAAPIDEGMPMFGDKFSQPMCYVAILVVHGFTAGGVYAY